MSTVEIPDLPHHGYWTQISNPMRVSWIHGYRLIICKTKSLLKHFPQTSRPRPLACIAVLDDSRPLSVSRPVSSVDGRKSWLKLGAQDSDLTDMTRGLGDSGRDRVRDRLFFFLTTVKLIWELREKNLCWKYHLHYAHVQYRCYMLRTVHKSVYSMDSEHSE